MRPTRNPNKPYTAITANIEVLCREDKKDDISGIVNIIETMKLLGGSGIEEASRAIRMELLYGNEHQRLRALEILDGLIQNAGETFQKRFANKKLVDSFDRCLDKHSGQLVRSECTKLLRGWSKYNPDIARLYKKAKALSDADNPFGDGAETERPAPAPVRKVAAPVVPVASPIRPSEPSHTRSSFFRKKDKKSKGRNKNFNFEAEKPMMKACVADSTIAASNLENVLRSQGGQQITANANALRYFEIGKKHRQKIKTYLHYLTEQKYEGSEEYVGPLLDVNSRLMDALKAFVNEDGSLDAESDSDDELAAQQHAFRMIEERHKTRQNTDAFSQNAFANMGSSSSKSPEKAPPMPPRRAPMAAPPQNEDDEADNDPFGDGNALDTPGAEKDEPRWAVV